MPKSVELTMVCPNSEKLLGMCRGNSLVVRISSFDEVQHVYARASAENRLLCIAVEERKPLSAITFREEWKAIPVSLRVPEMGDLKKVLRRIRLLRGCNLRVFMPAAHAANLTSLRILSSLGVSSGLTLEPPRDWDAMNDLMHYAMYTRTPHGDIDPFSYAKSFYSPQEFTNLGTPVFDNPLQYVHIDEEEHIALSAADLRDGRWIAEGLESLPSLCASAEYRHSINAWQAVFVEDSRCAYCPGWRLCQGTFLGDCEKDGNVLGFFNDFLSAADAAYAARQAGARWQP